MKTVQVMIKVIKGVRFCTFYSVINILIFLLHTNFSLGGNADEPTIFQYLKTNSINILFRQVILWKNENKKDAMY